MKRSHGLQWGLVILAVALAACQQGSPATQAPGTPSGAESIAGSYSCAPDPPPDDPGWPGPEDWELGEDGTITIARGGEILQEGTWRVEGDLLIGHLEGQDNRYTIEGDRFVSAESVPAGEGIFTCTKKA